MSRSALNFLVDLLAALVGLGMVLTGQTPAELKQRLSLPADTPDGTRLREIADRKGWSMPELREKATP